jgi:hypothetical protein
MAQTTNIEGPAVSELIDKITSAASKREALEIVGRYLIDTAIGVARTFSYGQPFAADDAGCTPKFGRTFTHRDWRDGQDLVQAEQTAGEDGFNIRFHRIEADLEALGADVRTVFQCIRTMRQQLSARLEEIKQELNRINVDLSNLHGDDLVIREPGRVVVGGKFLGVTPWFGAKMQAFETAAGVVLLPTPSPVDGGLGDPRIRRPAALGRLLEEKKKLRDLFTGDPVTKEKLVEEAGDLVSDDGFTLKEILEILPPGSKFTTADGLLKSVSEREAAAIRTSGFTEEVVGAMVGLEAIESPTSARVENFELVPAEARAVLTAAGVATVADLSKEDPKALADKLKAAGFATTPGTAATWVAGARTIGLVR